MPKESWGAIAVSSVFFSPRSSCLRFRFSHPMLRGDGTILPLNSTLNDFLPPRIDSPFHDQHGQNPEVRKHRENVFWAFFPYRFSTRICAKDLSFPLLYFSLRLGPCPIIKKGRNHLESSLPVPLIPEEFPVLPGRLLGWHGGFSFSLRASQGEPPKIRAFTCKLRNPQPFLEGLRLTLPPPSPWRLTRRAFL